MNLADMIHQYGRYFPVITIVAIFAIRGIGNAISNYHDIDNITYDRFPDDELKLKLLLHIRQDIKLIVFHLHLVIIMLAVIADLLK